MKTDIKILRIMYIIIFILGFVLYFHYTNNKEVEVNQENKNSYEYEIKDIEEESTGVTYHVNIDKKYSSDILTAISEEIRNDYNHIYNIEKTEDKAEYFNIVFYFEDKIYHTLTNDYVERNSKEEKQEDITK